MAEVEHSVKIRVRYAETDQMGVVYYSNYLDWFETGRIELLRARGVSYADMEKKGYVLPVIEAHCRYRAPARFDDIVTILARVESITDARMQFAYTVTLEDGTVLAMGWTKHVVVNTDWKPIRLPPDLAKALKG